MKFLFDLDDTLVSGDVVSDTSAKLLSRGLIDRLYTNKDVKNYDLRDLPDLVRIRATQTFSDPDHVWRKWPIPGVYYFLRTIEACGHQTGIVTARTITTITETIRFINARFHDIKFALRVNFVNTDDHVDMKSGCMPSKIEMLDKIKPDYYFDDNPDYCLQSKKLGIKTYLISNKYTPWNHDFAEAQRTELDPILVLRNVAFFPETRL